MHLEAWVAGHLDEQTLRDAVLAALAARPRARGRRAPGGRWRRRYAWEFPRKTDHDPVQRTTWASERDLAGQREAFLAAAPSLDSSPPVRLLLAAGPSEDRVILNAHHAALDGLSCLQLLREIAGRYSKGAGQAVSGAGEEAAVQAEPPAPERGPAAAPPAPPTPPAAAPPAAAPPAPAPPAPERPAPATPAPATPAPPPTVPASPAPGPASAPPHARVLPLPAARIAPHHEDGQSGPGQPGYGFHLVTVPDVPAAPAGGLRFTVNDVLVAAMIMAVAQWNGFHGGGRRRIRITMPLGGRAGGEALGNLSSLASVTAHLPRHGLSYRGLLADVARQTRYAKIPSRPAGRSGLARIGGGLAPGPGQAPAGARGAADPGAGAVRYLAGLQSG